MNPLPSHPPRWPSNVASSASRHGVVTATISGWNGRARLLGLAAIGSLLFACAKPTEAPPSVDTGKAPPTTPHRHEPSGSSPTPTPAPEAAVNAAGHKSYGAPLDASTPKVTLSEVLSTPSKFADKTVRMEGKITAVCQGMGCWLQLGDEKGSAHVKLRGHSFFVPKNSSGKTALVEARVLPVPDEGHCEEEAKEQTGVVAKVELEASGVEIF
jgi:hypothetical protein